MYNAPQMKRFVFSLFTLAPGLLIAADLRVGIIGTDTSHVIAFTKILNDPSAAEHVAGARVVAVYKSSSPDIEESHSRVEKYSDELRDKWKLEFVPRIGDLCGKVDAILLESLDGRRHLPEAKEAFACGKPVFIDKPLASTLQDAREIARLAKQAGVPWFSASALRFGDIVTKMKDPAATGVLTWGPGPEEAHHQLDLSWYGVHPIEMLYAMLGPGCEEVTRVTGATADVITCKWKDGRLGTVRTLRPYGDYGAVVYRAKDAVMSPAKVSFSYKPLVEAIVKFFETKQPPFPVEETLEMFAFMDAAQRSKASGGKPARLR